MDETSRCILTTKRSWPSEQSHWESSEALTKHAPEISRIYLTLVYKPENEIPDEVYVNNVTMRGFDSERHDRIRGATSLGRSFYTKRDGHATKSKCLIAYCRISATVIS